MTTPPSHWPDKAVSVVLTVLFVALVLNVAGRLIVAVLPVLIGMGVVAVVLRLVWWYTQL